MDSRITSSRSRPSNLNTDSDGGSDPSPPSGGWSCWIGAWCRTATARACSKACRPPPKPLGIGPTCSARSRSSLPCTASARRRPGAKLIRMDFSKRVAQLPTYPMEKLPAIKRRLIEQGVDVIDVGAGDADFPPPDVAVKALTRALQDPAMSRYAFQLGLPAFREAAAAYMQRRFGVAVDPFKEFPIGEGADARAAGSGNESLRVPARSAGVSRGRGGLHAAPLRRRRRSLQGISDR